MSKKSQASSKSERRTIVQDHPAADKPWALVLGGTRIVAAYETEEEARQHDARIRENEARDVEALRKGLPECELRLMAPADVVQEFPETPVQYQADVEFRQTPSGPQIAMWIPFNSLSQEMFGFREIIRPGAFSKTVREADVVSLWNHDPMWVLGRRSNKTLTIGLSEEGAEAVVQLDAEDRMHETFARRIERRDVAGASFGFRVVKEKWGVDEENDNAPLRELLEVKLLDISPVTFPAYSESDAEKRSLIEIVTAKSGAPFDELAQALIELRDGQVPAERAEIVREWATRLEGYLPPAGAEELHAIRKRKLDLIARQAIIT